VRLNPFQGEETMNGQLRLGLLALVTAILTAIPLHPQTLSGQEASARFRVMVPEIQPLDNADKKFGERLADQLRDLINEMTTHQPIEEKELKISLKEYDLDMEDLDCIRAKQLAPLINAQVVFCGNYTPEGKGFRVETRFIDQSGEGFSVDPISIPERGHREAAEHIYEALQVQSDQARASRFCGDYAASQQWGDAETNCRQAVELNPSAVNSRYTLGVVFQKTERLEEALAEFQRVLEINQLHEEALQWAGNLSATLGREEEGRAYYRRYLQLDPANANVRMKVAYELAQAGDPLGAMQFIDVGLELDPDNVDLLKQHGGFAFAAGAAAAVGSDELPPEVIGLYRKALGSFARVYKLEGAEMDVRYLENMVAANIKLGDFQAAVALAEQVLETHPDEASIWSYYGDALWRRGLVDEAIAALDLVVELEPGYPNVGVRQGKWLLDDGRVEDAIPVLQSAVARGEQTADDVCNMVFNNAIEGGIQLENWTYAIEVMRLAKEFEITEDMRQKVNFFLGYSILKEAIARQEPRTKQSAQATLPLFQEARRLLQTASGYAQKDGKRENDRLALLDNITTFIEIQEAIIKRGQ